MGIFKRKDKARPEAPDPTDAPGWDAIDEALARMHPGVSPVHMAMSPGLGLGSPLQGISAYRADDHWHLVTYGLTELFAKESDDPDTSGWGYELTLRVTPSDEPPAWAFNLLTKIAEVVQQGAGFALWHRLGVGGPITGSPDCVLHSLAFVPDALAPDTVEGSFGAFSLVQIVGLTDDELDEMKTSGGTDATEAVIERLRVGNPLLITDATRVE